MAGGAGRDHVCNGAAGHESTETLTLGLVGVLRKRFHNPVRAIPVKHWKTSCSECLVQEHSDGVTGPYRGNTITFLEGIKATFPVFKFFGSSNT